MMATMTKKIDLYEWFSILYLVACVTMGAREWWLAVHTKLPTNCEARFVGEHLEYYPRK